MTFKNNKIRIIDPSPFGIDKTINYDGETKVSEVLTGFFLHPNSERWIYTGEDIDFSMRLRQNGAKYKFLWETNFETSSRDVSFRRMFSESLGYIKLRRTQKE